MELKSSVCPDFTTNQGLKPLETLFLDYLELNGNHQSLMRWRDDNYTRLTKDEIEQYKEFFFSSTNSKEISYKWVEMINELCRMFGVSNIIKPVYAKRWIKSHTRNIMLVWYLQANGAQIVKAIKDMGLIRKYPKQEKAKFYAFKQKELHEEHLNLDNLTSNIWK